MLSLVQVTLACHAAVLSYLAATQGRSFLDMTSLWHWRVLSVVQTFIATDVIVTGTRDLYSLQRSCSWKLWGCQIVLNTQICIMLLLIQFMGNAITYRTCRILERKPGH